MAITAIPARDRHHLRRFGSIDCRCAEPFDHRTQGTAQRHSRSRVHLRRPL